MTGFTRTLIARWRAALARSTARWQTHYGAKHDAVVHNHLAGVQDGFTALARHLDLAIKNSRARAADHQVHAEVHAERAQEHHEAADKALILLTNIQTLTTRAL